MKYEQVIRGLTQRSCAEQQLFCLRDPCNDGRRRKRAEDEGDKINRMIFRSEQPASTYHNPCCACQTMLRRLSLLTTRPLRPSDLLPLFPSSSSSPSSTTLHAPLHVPDTLHHHHSRPFRVPPSDRAVSRFRSNQHSAVVHLSGKMRLHLTSLSRILHVVRPGHPRNRLALSVS